MKQWTSLEERYQAVRPFSGLHLLFHTHPYPHPLQEFGKDVSKAHRKQGMHWLDRGTGSFGTVTRPNPDQPWRPVRMRLTGTGAMMPEVSIDMAHTKKLGQTMGLSPSKKGAGAGAGAGRSKHRSHHRGPSSDTDAETVAQLRRLLEQRCQERVAMEKKLEQLEAKVERLRVDASSKGHTGVPADGDGPGVLVSPIKMSRASARSRSTLSRLHTGRSGSVASEGSHASSPSKAGRSALSVKSSSRGFR